MKKAFSILPFFLVLITGIGLCNDAPQQVGGFCLGADINQYQTRLIASTAMPIRYQEYLSEIEIRPDQNFKSGLITYGNCDKSGKIVRIRLKYRDGGRQFYDQLLERMEKRFGDPDDWRGDPFQTVLAWKWSFKDNRNNTVSLILQHNSKDTEQKLGNSIKLTLTSQIQQEQKCQQQKESNIKEKAPPAISGPIDWRLLLPE